MKKSFSRWLGLFSIIFGILAWGLLARLSGLPRFILPSPMDVWKRLLVDFSLLTINDALTEKSEDNAVLVVGSIEIYIPLAGMVDLAADKPRLEKELKEAQSHIERLEKLLSSDFANKAPAALVQKEREKLEGYKDTAEKIKAQLK